jgi:hypothetical protein
MSPKNKTALIILILMSLSVFITELHHQRTRPAPPNIMELFVGPKKIDCVGVAPQKCLVANNKTWYDPIEGFEYEEGYTYLLKVKKGLRKEPIPADVSKYTYTLKKIISKIEFATGIQCVQ